MSIREEIFESLPSPRRPPSAPLPPRSFFPNLLPAISTLIPPQSESKEPLNAIDLSRYEEQDSLTSDASLPTALNSLSRAYASAAYLSGRSASLGLLDAHGKNAWLIANWQLESYLATLEAELTTAKSSVDRLALERRRAQDQVSGQMRSLEEAWKKGIARTLETEVAVEELKREIRDRMRAQGDAMDVA
ncbi:unnamed protein product [Parascedosporium putredinis]|uniref:Pre-mRNA-splicing factor SPF27 n=1 Tax=Parascedosporium putredinis TaxID=1442378 RepID=A0A9P1M9E7_9PEZI|nr:unnamed protein product [Parascedosporium putredinis]CAI7995523.1 unnamed protein product [Parascedosporium putredinis]